MTYALPYAGGSYKQQLVTASSVVTRWSNREKEVLSESIHVSLVGEGLK